MAAKNNGGEGDERTSRYECVQQYLDAAYEGSCAEYQGYGRFWRLPLDEFLAVSIYGVRMIAPPAEDYSALTPRDVADQGKHTTETPDTSPATTENASGSCCGAEGDASTPADRGRGARSGLIKGLKGEYPFDGSQFPALMWSGGSRVPATQIAEIEQWIDDGCLETDDPTVIVDAGSNARRTMGDEAHPPFDGPVNQHRLELNGPRVRKNINCMTPEEFRLFQVAIAEMRRWDDFPADQRSWTFWSQVHPNNCQHGWEEFLPWHRAYLYEFEQRMQDWDPIVALPYWSWSEYYEQNKALGTGKEKHEIDNGFIPLRYGCWITKEAIGALRGKISGASLKALKSIQWDPAKPDESVFMSGPRLLVKAGIKHPSQTTSAYQEINEIFAQLLITNPLWHRPRWPGGSSIYFANYPSPADIANILEIPNFFSFASGPGDNHFFGALENIHNLIHNFSGGANPHYEASVDAQSTTEPQYGDMTSGAVTAYDPIFWGHHSNVDRLWWEWQQKHPGVFADNPDAVLPPWHYTVQDMRSIAPLGYEYSLASTHFPTDSTTFMTRFTSEKARIPERALGLHRTAEVRLHGVQYLETPGLVRAYLNNAHASADTKPHESNHFVGEFHIFQGQCVGGPGHCDPSPPRQPGDLRARDRKTPRNIRIDATQTVQRLLENGATDFDVQLVVLDLEGKPARNVLKLSSVSLDFSD